MNKTISLQLAKKIHDKCKQKGIEMPESALYMNVSNGAVSTMKDWKDYPFVPELISAYDIPELLEWLPEGTEIIKYEKYISSFRNLAEEKAENAPEALAELLLYLLDNDLLTNSNE